MSILATTATPTTTRPAAAAITATAGTRALAAGSGLREADAARRPADGGPPLGPEDHVPVPGTMSFGEFLSGLNPLQHLPGIGSIYRAATGDVAPAAMRVLGGALVGGPIGAISAAVFSAVDALSESTAAAAPDRSTPSRATLARARAAYGATATG